MRKRSALSSYPVEFSLVLVTSTSASSFREYTEIGIPSLFHVSTTLAPVQIVLGSGLDMNCLILP